MTYQARPKGREPDEEKPVEPAPEQPAKKKKEENPLLMKTGMIRVWSKCCSTSNSSPLL